MRMNHRMTLEQRLTICKHWTSPGSMPPPSPCAPRRRIASCSLDRPTRCGLSYDMIINEIWIDEIFHRFPFDTSPSIRSEFHRRASSYAEPSGQLPGKPRWVEIDPEHWSWAVEFLKIFSFVCGNILLTFKKLDRRPIKIWWVIWVQNDQWRWSGSQVSQKICNKDMAKTIKIK